jgi:hypothetical protein
MLRHLVTQSLTTYYNEPCKKALLISEIMGVIKNLNPQEGFISQNTKTGVWEEVGDITSHKTVGTSISRLPLCYNQKIKGSKLYITIFWID